MNDLPPIDFSLTPQEEIHAAWVTVQIKRHRDEQSERERRQALAQWRGEQNRPAPHLAVAA